MCASFATIHLFHKSAILLKGSNITSFRNESSVRSIGADGSFHQNTIILLLKPFHGISLSNSVLESNSRLLSTTVCDVVTGSSKHNIEIHSIDSNARIVLYPKINMLGNSESKIPCFGKIATTQFILLHLETLLQDFFCFGSSNSAMDGNLFITTDAKGSYGVAGFGEDRCLTGQSFQDLSSTNQSVTTLSNADVDTQFLNTDLLHWVDFLYFLFLSHFLSSCSHALPLISVTICSLIFFICPM